MKLTGLCIALPVMLLLCSCSIGVSGTGTCSPTCQQGQTCFDSKCVPTSSIGLDAGTIGSNSNDGGVHSNDGGLVVLGDGGFAACAADTTKAQLMPLDMYIMLDQSKSMGDAVTGGGTKWTAVTGALEAFLQQSLTSVSAGLQYFGVPAGAQQQCTVTSCNSNADCTPVAACGTCSHHRCSGNGGGTTDSCNAADYAVADVEIAALPGVAGAITTSIGGHGPTTSTPTAPALQGAINHAQAWAQAHPEHVVIAILATDGEPTECNPQDIPSIEAIAAAGVSGTPKILTFVIGIDDGSGNLANLNDIAAGGGTTSAFIVSTTSDVNTQFLNALNKIRGAALGCNYAIPAPTNGSTLDFSKVNVQYTPGGGTASVIGQVPDKAHCPTTGVDAWYYDIPSAPTQIILCDSTCQKVEADSKGEVDLLLGCQTVSPPIY